MKNNQAVWLQGAQPEGSRDRPVSGAPLIFHYAGSVPERCTPKTGRTRWKNQISLTHRRFATWPAGSGLALTPANWPSFHSAESPVSPRNWLALARLRRELK